MKKVLIVDDETTSAEVLAVILHDEGFDVMIAANGRQALDRIAQDMPDLLVTDYMMPVMSGVELVRTLRRDPARARLPVLMISGVPVDAMSAYQDCYDLFLHKPFRIDALLEAVARLLAPGRAADAPSAGPAPGGAPPSGPAP